MNRYILIFQKICCFIGIHKWNQTRLLTAIDSFPPAFIKYDNPSRTCDRCGLKQRWLPGYGGSEFGCWTKHFE